MNWTTIFRGYSGVILAACLAVPVRLGAQSINIMNPSQYDDWQKQMQDQINKTLGKNGLTPGDFLTWSFQTCIDGEWATVNFKITGAAGGGVALTQLAVIPEGRDCKTSKDFQAIDLANADSLVRLVQLINQIQPKSLPPERSAAITLMPFPPLSHVPFLPVYLPSAYPDPAPCNPATSQDVLFVNHASASVTRQTSCSGALVTTIKTGTNPLQVAVTPDGSLALVTGFDSTLTFIDTATNNATIVRTPGDINPSGVAISPDGTYAYVTSFNIFNPSVLKVDLAKRTMVQTVGVSSYPQSVFFNPDGSQAYVTFPFQNLVYILDTLTTTVAKTIILPGPAFGVAFDSTGSRAYITCRTTPGTVQVFDTTTYKILQAVTVGQNPCDILVTPDDQLIAAANFEGKSLSVIDATSLKVVSVDLPARPRGLTQMQ
jgi:DNA-binding beta-propeller fold protein YncE